MTNEHGGCCGGAAKEATKKDGCCGGGEKQGGSCCSGGKSGSMITVLAVAVAIGAVAYAVGNKGGHDAAAPLSKAEVEKLIKGDDAIVAKLNGHDIHKSDVALAIKELGANVPAENIDAVLPAFVDQYINLKLISSAAGKDGVAKDPEVKRQISNAEDQIIRAAYLRKVFDGKLSDDDLKKAYADQFEGKPMPEEVRARHILVDDEAKAKDIIARLNAGESFEKLAAENSKDPSAQRGGDLGYFTKADMVKEFGDAAFSMRPGSISQTPVKTQFGWHIIKVEDKRQRKKPTFDEAKPMLEQQARQALLDAKLTGLRSAAKIEVEDAYKPKQPAEAAPAAVDAAKPAEAPAAPAEAPAQK